MSRGRRAALPPAGEPRSRPDLIFTNPVLSEASGVSTSGPRTPGVHSVRSC